jgi:hypothetical protein
MTVFVALVLTLLTFAFIIYPFFKRRLPAVDSGGDENLQELYSQRDTTYSMLKELEFDLQSGILTDEDYRDLEAGYKSKAISTIKDIDNLQKGSKVPEKGKAPKKSGVQEEIERQVRELRQGKGPFCPQCGARSQEGDRFCSHCGASLSRGDRVD